METHFVNRKESNVILKLAFLNGKEDKGHTSMGIESCKSEKKKSLERSLYVVRIGEDWNKFS